jgi:hypothetical protein
VLPVPAAAEWHFTPMLGLTFGKSTNLRDNAFGVEERHRTYGLAVSRFGEGILAAEGLVMFTPDFFQGSDPQFRDLSESSRVVSAMGNLVLTTPRLWTEYSLRPFLSGGIGVIHAVNRDPPELSVLPDVDATLLGVNVGVGAVGFLSDRTGIRFEVRYFDTLKRAGMPPLTTLDGERARLRHFTASIGLVFRRR